MALSDCWSQPHTMCKSDPVHTIGVQNIAKIVITTHCSLYYFLIALQHTTVIRQLVADSARLRDIRLSQDSIEATFALLIDISAR